MLKFPRPGSYKWFILGAIFSLFFTLIYASFFALVVGNNLSLLNFPGILLIFFVPLELIALGGFLGYSLYLVLSFLGLCLGLILFLVLLVHTPRGGFEDIDGLLSFFSLTALGLLVGVVSEFLRYLWKKFKAR